MTSQDVLGDVLAVVYEGAPMLFDERFDRLSEPYPPEPLRLASTDDTLLDRLLRQGAMPSICYPVTMMSREVSCVSLDTSRFGDLADPLNETGWCGATEPLNEEVKGSMSKKHER